MTTYRNGKAHSHKLGTYPAMNLKEANRQARAYFENPTVFEAKAAVGSFKAVADNWIKRHVEEKQLRTEREIKRHLSYYVYPQWKNTPYLSIRRKEVNALLDHIVDKHGRAMADAVLTTLRSLMTWQQARDESCPSRSCAG